VAGLKVNGGDAAKAWMPEALVSTGGTLDFTLWATPTAWGSGAADAPPSFRDQEKPSLSFVNPARAVTPAGSTSKVSVGVQDLSGAVRSWTYSAGSVDGITLTPATGSIAV